tara:strand:+ start:2691 stop:2894 length:204 start_codon:yes stop_codon:yes gene_type:complete
MITMIVGVVSASLMMYKTKEKSMKEEPILHYNQLYEEPILHYNQLYEENQNKFDYVYFNEIRLILMI